MLGDKEIKLGKVIKDQMSAWCSVCGKVVYESTYNTLDETEFNVIFHHCQEMLELHKAGVYCKAMER